MPRFAESCFIGIVTSVLVCGQAFADEGLYENSDVVGALECEVDESVSILVDEGRAIRCDFESQSVSDNLNRYFVSPRALDAGNAAVEGDVLFWTVLYLGEGEPKTKGSMLGIYGHALTSVAHQYGLNPSTLVGGSGSRFALEPRSGDGRTNAAGAVSALEISY